MECPILNLAVEAILSFYTCSSGVVALDELFYFALNSSSYNFFPLFKRRSKKFQKVSEFFEKEVSGSTSLIGKNDFEN